MNKRSRFSPRAAAILAAATLACVSSLACSTAEDRARDHIEKGQAYLAEGRVLEARLEFQSALRFDQTSADGHNALAILELGTGNSGAALAHLEEAYRIDPSDSQASVNLAYLIQSDEPERAKEMIDGVVDRDPTNPAGHIGRSNLALATGSTRRAVIAARKAMEVAPDDPRADYQLGYALQAMIREGLLTDAPVADSVYESTLRAFERSIEKGGDRPWNTQIEEAGVFAAWAGKNQAAAQHFRTALENARQNGTPREIQRGAAKAAVFAESVRNWELREYALALLVEAEPRDYLAWRDLALVRGRLRKDPEETWKELVSMHPDNPRAHIEYARFMISRWKLDDALAYLEDKAAEGMQPAVLRSAIASTQLAANRLEDARRTVRQLESEYPDHLRTALARAQLDIRQGRVKRALPRLRRLTEETQDSDTLLLLARAELAIGNRKAALAAAERAVEVRPHFALEATRLQGQLQAGQGRCGRAIQTFQIVEERDALTPNDQLLLARCYYATGQVLRGRGTLKAALEERRPPSAVVLEFARREGDEPAGRAEARKHLGLLLRFEPRNWDALRELNRLDLADGGTSEALKNLNRAIARAQDQTPPDIRLVRAQLRARAGQEQGVLEDALAAFEAQPTLPGSLELVVALYLRTEQTEQALAAAEAAQRADALDSERRLLLGRLYRMNGRDAEAVEALAQALEDDDTSASAYFHMGMALRALDRDEEGTRALEKALSISSSFPEAEHARRALEGSRGAGAS